MKLTYTLLYFTFTVMKECPGRVYVGAAVLDLIYWRDVKKTGVVFGSTLVLLLSLALFSVLSVVAYLSLVTLTITISYRVYRSTLSSLQKTGEGHPFQSVLTPLVHVSLTPVVW